MKHLPNLLTLCNLVCGCIATAFILNSQPWLSGFNGQEYWVTGTEQAYLGGLFIGLAAIFDLLDGFAARALNVFSPIGKDLDSLADLVSFGVAPSMIFFKMLWGAYMLEEYAMDVSMLAMIPAFLIVCFGALRLARFNTTAGEQKWSFTGLPIPAVGIIVASFPLINWYTPQYGQYLQNKWTLYILIGVLSWLMVSRIRFFKFVPPKWQLSYLWPQLIVIAGGALAIPLLKFAAIPVAFALYVLLSLVYKVKEA